MAASRKVQALLKSQPTLEGAGVHLRRVFGFSEVPRFDPFLLLDDFRSDRPDQYLAGFPWHPHRGIETITYMLAGTVEHGDSLGNAGSIGAGDVQWMTAGSGIVHQEMPRGDEQGSMGGFQLWANLPARDKMMDPRYRDIRSSQIPVVEPDGAKIRVIAGEACGVKGPVEDVVTDPTYLDVTLTPQSELRHPVKSGHTVFAYVFSGQGTFAEEVVPSGSVALLGDGEEVRVQTGAEPARFLLVSGLPLGEPVAWQGPIVMNTQEELKTAFREFSEGSFIRVGR